jgi:SPP1 gp7 family putative phage head morphogenesis protein
LLVISKKKFAYETTQEKVKGFMGWLRKEVDQNILAVEKRDGRTVTHRRPWENTYISRAYTKGMARAESELKKAGVLTKKPTFFTDSINAQFNLPFHAEKVASIYTRVYRDLEGITEYMDLKISRTLAEGLATGLSPLEMARELADEVDMSIGRARTLARTEVIRAHHMGNIATYEQAGIEGVTVQAEWLATDDDKVCEFCEDMNGKVFTLEEIAPMIPAHPNCRCVAIPSFPEEED